MSSTIMPSHQRRDSIQAFGLALLIEVAIVVVAGVILIGNAQTKPAISEPVPITLADLPPDEKPPEPKPVPPPPVPQPKVKAVIKPNLPKPQAPTPPQEMPPIAAAPSEIAAVPTAFTQPAPPPPPATSGKADAQATYAARVNTAVLAAHRQNYPAAATAIRFNGKTQVEFHLQDGILVGEPHVLTSCGNGIFDKSALQAVQIAHYPVPPEELRGDNTKITVWVHFDEH
ncbi:MAG TPA: TonB family protein [Burkholderiaceae bacterium]|jgi:protein TonB|nr:TonB family protein [Burkholderiaceae bacterium]